MKLKVLHGEANPMNDVDVSANRKKMIEKLAGIDLEVILNTDEAELFFKHFLQERFHQEKEKK